MVRVFKNRDRISALADDWGWTFARREDGSLTIFSLFLFIMILMISGMAVDMIMHERQRVLIQNTLDTAVLAAGSLSSGAATDADIIAKVNDYVTKAGIDPNLVTVNVGSNSSTNRKVTATANFKIDTIFMGLLGKDELHGGAGGSAVEGEEKVEIVLVLDVSGSMGNSGKIEALRPAAKGFVTEMISKLGADKVAISVVPYNQQVHLDDDLRSRIDWQDAIGNVPGAASSYPGSIQNFATHNPLTRCARFRDSDFGTARLTSTQSVEGSAVFSGYYGDGGTPFDQYSASSTWCASTNTPVMLYQNDETALHTYIDGLFPRGWTAIDYGMNWATGILHGDFRPIVKDMVDNSILPAAMDGHPFDYGNPDVKKVIVLMTDGMNTDHLDLGDAFKSGPSRVWYSATQAAGNEFNGFLVEMPNNATSQRWYVPNLPGDASDDAWLAESALPADAEQWDYHKVYNRFRHQDVAEYFFVQDTMAYAAHNTARTDVGGHGTADTRVRNICAEARGAGVEVFTIAFQAPSSSETLLRDCVNNEAGYFFDVNGLDIANAFNSIAITLTKLRLTQ